ncbi:MAG: hypothetical protein ACXV7J_07005 [Methylomonas sp.]
MTTQDIQEYQKRQAIVFTVMLVLLSVPAALLGMQLLNLLLT